MENPFLHLKSLRRETPEVPPSSRDINLCDPRVLLAPEQLQERQAALARLAVARSQGPPADVIVQGISSASSDRVALNLLDPRKVLTPKELKDLRLDLKALSKQARRY